MSTDASLMRRWSVDYLSELLHLPAEEINLDSSLVDLGLDSADAILMSGEMEEQFGIELDPTSFLEVESLREMINRLSQLPTSN